MPIYFMGSKTWKDCKYNLALLDIDIEWKCSNVVLIQ